ncbi:MAG: heparan-alpha-glucosaminide N-acetyltransferase [archaeon]|jgi:uncharacterized membrane protein|nr:heparan-alpha-glucosaminide N-acetyltransferase [archaeon]
MDKGRLWEIDALRGLAISAMIAFHFLFDLNYFGNLGWKIGQGGWWIFARSIALTFILLVGISLTLSYNRNKRNLPYYIKRGLKIFSWGLLITAVTWIFLPAGTIYFGILHFIGLSIILAYPFLVKRKLAFVVGLLTVFAGIVIMEQRVQTYSLLWLGLAPANFYTFDYFPLFPWFGYVLFGIFIGNSLYKRGERQYKIQDLSTRKTIRFLSFLGRNSLFIYLIHQPISVALVLAIIG